MCTIYIVQALRLFIISYLASQSAWFCGYRTKESFREMSFFIPFPQQTPWGVDRRSRRFVSVTYQTENCILYIGGSISASKPTRKKRTDNRSRLPRPQTDPSDELRLEKYPAKYDQHIRFSTELALTFDTTKETIF